jgi:hypothetical protein
MASNTTSGTRLPRLRRASEHGRCYAPYDDPHSDSYGHSYVAPYDGPYNRPYDYSLHDVDDRPAPPSEPDTSVLGQVIRRPAGTRVRRHEVAA